MGINRIIVICVARLLVPQATESATSATICKTNKIDVNSMPFISAVLLTKLNIILHMNMLVYRTIGWGQIDLF